MKYLQDALKRLEVDASRHKERLQENAALLQFMWKADVVESWIGKFDTREILGY
jgi:spectrin alpha